MEAGIIQINFGQLSPLLLVITFPLTGKIAARIPSKLKTSLMPITFNGPLMKGDMNLGELLKYWLANQLLQSIFTAYYFPGYS